MKIEDSLQQADVEPGAAARVIAPPRTNNQIRATATADRLAAKARWKALMPEARAAWEKVPPEELATVDGNFHRLAGLVQLRYQISREESDQQVKTFFDKHYPAA